MLVHVEAGFQPSNRGVNGVWAPRLYFRDGSVVVRALPTHRLRDQDLFCRSWALQQLNSQQWRRVAFFQILHFALLHFGPKTVYDVKPIWRVFTHVNGSDMSPIFGMITIQHPPIFVIAYVDMAHAVVDRVC